MSIKKNLFYNSAYQVLIIFIPLILSPYLSRTLGATGIGVYSYTYSMAFYFMILSMMGIANYGNRSIAKISDNNEQVSKTFCSIYALQIILSVITIAAYIIYVLFICQKYVNIAWIHIFYILSYAVDITWYFYGKEDFKIVLLKNLFVKILTLILVLLLVKSNSDVWIYTLIMSVSTFIGQLLTWPQLLREVTFKRPTIPEIMIHLKPVFILFIPMLAISIFSYMDKVMLGSSGFISETGLYENAEKIISIPKAIITAVGTVMLPRTANLLAHGKIDEIYQSIKLTMIYVLAISIACTFGLCAVATNFSILYWGKDFADCGMIISCLSPALIFSVFGNVIRCQYLIPKEMDSEYTISLVLGAFINLVFNYFLIPVMGALGAAIGTVAAEITLCTYQTWVVRKNLPIMSYIKLGIPFLFIGTIMYFIIILINQLLSLSLISLCLEIGIGAIVYLILSLIFFKFSKDQDIKNIYYTIVCKVLKKTH